MKLNLGAGPEWEKTGWCVVDHKKLGLKVQQAWRIPYKSNTFKVVFCSHMFEHISHFKIEQVICEINRVMKGGGGVLRKITPNQKKKARADVNKDVKLMDK